MEKEFHNHLTEYMVPMGDGVLLYTVIVLPEKEGKYPAIITRTPYAPETLDLDEFRKNDLHSYAFVYQECRGTGRSQGDCIPYLNEKKDGLALLEWVRKQDFYNGELFLNGGSYLASVHLSYLNTDPPDVKAAVLTVQDSNRYNILYRNGLFKSGLHGSWAVFMYKKNSIKKKNFVAETMHSLPLKGFTEMVFGEKAEFLEEEICHPDPADPFWSTPEGGGDYAHAVRDCKIPVLLSTSFYDLYTGGVFEMWKELPESRRKDCALIVSPYDHAWLGSEREDLPPFPGGKVNEIAPDFTYNWFDHFRKGTELKFIHKGQIVYYPLFEGPWRYEKDLTNGKKELKFFLTGEKSLSLTQPEGTKEITYLYNPYAPANFKGGCCRTFGGMQKQDEEDFRYDVISFLTEPFTEDTLIKGMGKVSLKVRSTAPDTCFYVRLSIVREEGTYCLRDDIDTLCRTNPDYSPNSEMTLSFEFPEHCFLVAKGEKLRLDVSSSCGNHYLVHTNRKGSMIEQTGADPAWNTILTGASFMTLYAE